MSIIYITYPLEYGKRPKSINPVNNVTTLIYVSCGFDALARDTDLLLSLGGGGLEIERYGYGIRAVSGEQSRQDRRFIREIGQEGN